MTDKKKQIVQEVLISLVAQEKLEEIKKYLKETEDIKKEDLFAIIEKTEETIFE